MTGRSTGFLENKKRPARFQYPFAAIVGQEQMKTALLLNVIAPTVGGVLIMGERGTGKSTAVRAVAELLPSISTVQNCSFNCDPKDEENFCDGCLELKRDVKRLPRVSVKVPVVELPLGATEDRVCGTLDIGQALREGARSFEPGLLARANRGILYIDEVNLLEDHLVDLLLDASVTGINRVEREGFSLEHPARFILAGSGNPEEGELRPQLLDRFGLSVEVKTPRSIEERVEVVERNERFTRDPQRFIASFESEQTKLQRRLARARRIFPEIAIARELLRKIAELCQNLEIDGHRGELTIARASRALAAFEGRRQVSADDVRRVAALALKHRLRKDPLESSSGGGRVDEKVKEFFGDEPGRETTETKTPDKPNNEKSGTREIESPAKNNHSQTETQSRFASKPDFAKSGDRTLNDDLAAPPDKAQLKTGAFNLLNEDTQKTGAKNSHARRGEGKRVAIEHSHGRHTGSHARPFKRGRVDLFATLKVAALRVKTDNGAGQIAPLKIAHADLRYKRFSRRVGTLFIFAVDTSGSMALNRIGQAKAALGQLLRKSYVNRDRVALVSFRGATGEIILWPSSSASRAKKMLDALPVGGATPLPAGLLRSLELVRRARSDGAGKIVLMIFTDGIGNMPLKGEAGNNRLDSRARVRAEVRRLGSELKAASISTVVVDTGNRFTKGNDGEELAAALAGRYLHLPSVINEQKLKETFGVNTL